MPFPRVRVTFVEVPFPFLSRCLAEGQGDLLLTIAAVCDRDIELFPLPLTSRRIGLVSVSARHPLAQAYEVDVAEFCEYRLLCNPEIPDEWMRQFWRADVRPRSEARLVTTHGANHPSVVRDALAGSVAVVSLEPRTSLPRGLKAVTLIGSDPLTFYAAPRRADRRGVAPHLARTVQSPGTPVPGAAASHRHPGPAAYSASAMTLMIGPGRLVTSTEKRTLPEGSTQVAPAPTFSSKCSAMRYAGRWSAPGMSTIRRIRR